MFFFLVSGLVLQILAIFWFNTGQQYTATNINKVNHSAFNNGLITFNRLNNKAKNPQVASADTKPQLPHLPHILSPLLFFNK